MILRRFTGGYGISQDYCRIHEFLVACKSEAYSYARFDWMITHRPYLEEQFLNRIGIWEDNNTIVATALYDTSLDDVFLIAQSGYEYLYKDMISYARENMVNTVNPDFRLFIDNFNDNLKKAAEMMGFHPLEDNEKTARYDLNNVIPDSCLKEGFTIVTLEDERDYDNYLHCLFRGFNRDNGEETYSFGETDQKEAESAYERKYVDLSLKLSVKAPDGHYVAHCGMWYDRDSEFAIIEPVCTDPDYRGMGLGKEAVLEGLRRVKAQGAGYALVGSDQQFYYSIGLKPYIEGTFWIE